MRIFGESVSDMNNGKGWIFSFWRASSVYGSINKCLFLWVATLND